MRAILCASLCNCRHRLTAGDDEELVAVAIGHLRRDHPAAPLGEARVRAVVAARAYNVESAVPYAQGIGPDEEFGPEPY